MPLTPELIEMQGGEVRNAGLTAMAPTYVVQFHVIFQFIEPTFYRYTLFEFGDLARVRGPPTPSIFIIYLRHIRHIRS